MAIRTAEQLQSYFAQRKAIQQRKKEREKQRYKKASQDVKKALADKLSTKAKQMQPEQNKQPNKTIIRISTYKRNVFVRETPDENLYNSWDEIKEAEKRGEGKLNWEFLKALIQRTKRIIQQS